ncbi:MAG: hypothetical protein GXP32_03805 [Kiritimatiellaeota bacterium]|nr:hypothetical protein [Kiritimatiellota bacterium]
MTTESNEPKASGSPSQSVFQAMFLIACFAIFGLFAYDYLKKNKEIAEYKSQESTRAKESEARARELEVKLTKVKELASLYKKTLRENTRNSELAENAMKPRDEIVNVSPKQSKQIAVKSFASEDDDVVRINIARKVSSDLAPIISKVNKSQNLTNEKLDKAIADLITLLDKETEKSQKIAKSLTKALVMERRRGDKLQRKLTLTNEVVTELSTFTSELGTLYVNAHEDDSVLGNIGTAAMAPVKVLQNTLSLNFCFGRDKRDAEKIFKKRLKQIMARYRRIQVAGTYRPRKSRKSKVKEPKLKK